MTHQDRLSNKDDPVYKTASLWRQDDGEAAIVVYAWQRIDDAMECVGIEIRTYHSDLQGLEQFYDLADVPLTPRRITTDTIRSLPTGSLIRNERRAFLRSYERVRRELEEAGLSDRDRASLQKAEDKWSGRVWTATRLAELAKVYRAAEVSGEPVQQAVATHFKIKTGAAAKAIFLARAKDFLPPAKHREG